MLNDEMRRNWTDNASGWVQHEGVFDAIFAPLTDHLLETADLRRAHRVLDVGCGSGTLLAAAVAAGADPVGIDVSPGMVEAAQRRVPTAEVLLADAQTADLVAAAAGRPFDRVVSRFGVMFFADPVAAFTGIRSAAAPGGRLAFACWRAVEQNPLMTLGQDVLLGYLAPQPAPLPGAPGPDAFSDPDRVRSVLGDAGWSDVEVAAYDFGLDFAYDGSDGVDNRLATILATTTGRRARQVLEVRLGARGWADVLDEVRAHLRGHLVDGALRLPGAVWLVTATA